MSHGNYQTRIMSSPSPVHPGEMQRIELSGVIWVDTATAHQCKKPRQAQPSENNHRNLPDLELRSSDLSVLPRSPDDSSSDNMRFTMVSPDECKCAIRSSTPVSLKRSPSRIPLPFEATTTDDKLHEPQALSDMGSAAKRKRSVNVSHLSDERVAQGQVHAPVRSRTLSSLTRKLFPVA